MFRQRKIAIKNKGETGGMGGTGISGRSPARLTALQVSTPLIFGLAGDSATPRQCVTAGTMRSTDVQEMMK